MLCRKLSLFADAFVAIDGSKFKFVRKNRAAEEARYDEIS